MNTINKDGLLLCEIQATAFEKSVEKLNSSSDIFIRRFMNSQIAKKLDDKSVLDHSIQANDILELIEEEYGPTNYGTIKYTHNEIFWIGYIYRYFAITYDLTSVQVYKIIKPKELREVFLSYHTLDPSQAIERILEAKGRLLDDVGELERQYNIYKKIRKSQTI